MGASCAHARGPVVATRRPGARHDGACRLAAAAACPRHGGGTPAGCTAWEGSKASITVSDGFRLDRAPHEGRQSARRACPGPGPLPRCTASALGTGRAGRGDPRTPVSTCTGEARGEPGAALGPQWELAVSVLRRRAAHRPGPGTIDRRTCEAALGRPSGTAAPATGPKAGCSGFFFSGL